MVISMEMISLYDFERSLDKKIRMVQQESWAKGYAEGFAEGFAEGYAESLTKGEAKKAKEYALLLHREGMPLAKIAMLVGYETETVKQWLSAFEQ